LQQPASNPLLSSFFQESSYTHDVSKQLALGILGAIFVGVARLLRV
jgi:hypothetical protein